MAFALRSDRALEQAILVASDANVDGDQDVAHGLPDGFGDCLILEWMVLASVIATVRASPEIAGPVLYLVPETDTGVVDMLGGGRWIQHRATRLAAHGFPEQAVFMRARDRVDIVFAEVDTNVTPTADMEYFLRVRRLRQQGPQMPVSFQLTS